MLKEPLDSQVKYIGIYVDFILERFLGFIPHGKDLESPFITVSIAEAQAYAALRGKSFWRFIVTDIVEIFPIRQ